MISKLFFRYEKYEIVEPNTFSRFDYKEYHYYQTEIWTYLISQRSFSFKCDVFETLDTFKFQTLEKPVMFLIIFLSESMTSCLRHLHK